MKFILLILLVSAQGDPTPALGIYDTLAECHAAHAKVVKVVRQVDPTATHFAAACAPLVPITTDL
jgi:hypothetical protein